MSFLHCAQTPLRSDLVPLGSEHRHVKGKWNYGITSSGNTLYYPAVENSNLPGGNMTHWCLGKRGMSRFLFNKSLLWTCLLCLLPKHCMQSKSHWPLEWVCCTVHPDGCHSMSPTCTGSSWDESDLCGWGCQSSCILELMFEPEQDWCRTIHWEAAVRSSSFKEELIPWRHWALASYSECFQSCGDVKVRSRGWGQKGLLAVPVKES